MIRYSVLGTVTTLTKAPAMFCVFLLVVSLTAALALPRLQQDQSSCLYEGKTYQYGESFHPDPCSPPCYCGEGGRVHCAVYSVLPCQPPPCLDAVPDPNPCSNCMICPNGVNCRAYDGTILNGTSLVSLDKYTICYCDGYRTEALCMME